MRRAPLLRAHLDDAVVAAGRVDHHPPFADGERERLFDVDVLARLAGQHGRDRVPVIRRADDHRVDVLAIEDAAEVARRERRRLIEVLLDALGRLGDLLVVHVAEGDALRAEAQGVAQNAAPLAATTDEADANPPVGAGDAVLGRGVQRDRRGGGQQGSSCDSGGDVLDEGAAAARLHADPSTADVTTVKRFHACSCWVVPVPDRAVLVTNRSACARRCS